MLKFVNGLFVSGPPIGVKFVPSSIPNSNPSELSFSHSKKGN